jgi:hypothetical protein
VLRRSFVGLTLIGMALIGGGALHPQAPALAAVQTTVLHQGVGNFDGPWYFAGDLSSPALILQAGTLLTLMNEQGRVATGSGTVVQVTANWGEGPITGTLTADQRQLNWDNGTFWQRRALIDAALLGAPNVGGIWYVGGDATRRALIVQTPGGNLQLMNEQGRPSPGGFVGPNTIQARAWEGGVTGTLSPDGNFIDWSNGTSWRR